MCPPPLIDGEILQVRNFGLDVFILVWAHDSYSIFIIKQVRSLLYDVWVKQSLSSLDVYYITPPPPAVRQRMKGGITGIRDGEERWLLSPRLAGKREVPAYHTSLGGQVVTSQSQRGDSIPSPITKIKVEQPLDSPDCQELPRSGVRGLADQPASLPTRRLRCGSHSNYFLIPLFRCGSAHTTLTPNRHPADPLPKTPNKSKPEVLSSTQIF